LKFIKPLLTSQNLSFTRNEGGEYDGGVEGVARRYVSWCRHQRQYQTNNGSAEEKAYIDSDWSRHIAKFLSSIQEARKAGETVTFYCG